MMLTTTFKMTRIRILSIAFAALLSGGVIASSGGGESYSYDKPAPKPIDIKYEHGKSIYQGRDKSIGKINFCISDGTSVTPVKASTLRPFKKGSVQNLTSSLYDCNNSSQKISEQINSKNLSYVVYYLNKRFRLNLHNG